LIGIWLNVLSLKNSKDSVEQLYGDDVLKHFPNYEKFWVEFIGNPKADQVEPYKYRYPDNMTTEERNRIEKSYLKIRMSHYTLFCHLAGAHFQEKELKNARSVKDPNEKYFRCCEHFEAAYMHIGSAFYVLATLWNTVLKLIEHREGGRGFDKLERFLNAKGKSELVKGLKEIDEDIMNRRHLPVHYGRVIAMWYQGEMYVPLKVREEMLWSQGNETTEWRRSDSQLHSDLVQTEKLINELHEILIEEYRGFITSKNIVIDHGEKMK
jgi:hypothetical protein